jgi:alanyl-tRNA synthetase
MTANEIRQKYLDFFKSKGHTIIPSASLIPENDPTTLFIGSGMQPLIPYLMGEKHPEGTRLTDSQKSFRPMDIEEVGDNRHDTFFEMLGNWSLGDYFKNEQLPWFFEFLTKEVGLKPERLYVSVYRGNKEIGVERDTKSVEVWKEIFSEVGIKAKDVDFAEKNGMQDGRIFYYPDSKNWWSRSGEPKNMPVGEIGGPDSEVFYDLGAELKRHENSQWKDEPCHINCDCGRFIEIGNSVFIEFVKTERGFEPLPQKNVDFGGGLERIAMVAQGKDNVFETDLFINVLNKIEELSSDKKYRENMRPFEVIADHLKAATFIMGDDKGISPSNLDQGYIVRRLIRRAIRYGRQLGITQESWTKEIAEIVISDYKEAYPELERNKEFVVKSLEEEERKFGKTLEKGLKILNKIKDEVIKISQLLEEGKKFNDEEKKFLKQEREWLNENIQILLREIANNPPVRKSDKKMISPYFLDGLYAFNLYATYGFPIELIEEELKSTLINVSTRQFRAYLDFNNYIDKKRFEAEMKKHQELSRTASAGKFKGGLADAGEETAKLHTATHLLHAALRKVLGDHVQQKGSNITAERLRFDFTHGEKMTPEQIKEVEDLVNEQIQKETPVICHNEMSVEEAKEKGAIGLFESKYGKKVKMYEIGQFSREICGGPHVDNTGKLGKFKIKKEQSSSSGVRRIKAVLQ